MEFRRIKRNHETNVEAVAESYFQFGCTYLVILKYLVNLWILASTKINLYLASLSFLLISKCFLIETAFLIKLYKFSGISGAQPYFFKILRIFFPVKNLTWGIPCWSLNKTPIWLGVKPFLANLAIKSVTPDGDIVNHFGVFLL